MRKRFEAWQDDNGITVSDEDGIRQTREKGLFLGEPKLLHIIVADTSEEAMAVHHIKMGWEPYRPQGDSAKCPKCGSIYYPHGSSECPKCGPI